MVKKNLAYLSLMCIVLALFTIYGFANSSLEVTATTNKSSYILRETVDVYGNVTYNGQPVQEGLVAIQVANQLSNIVIRTVPVGSIESATWGVEVLSVSPCDSAGNPKNSFERGEWAYFNTTVRNNMVIPKNVLITINVYDNAFIPLGMGYLALTVDPGKTVTYMSSIWINEWASIGGIWINEWASIGDARAYANVYSDWPKNNGYPYSPEKSANFTIVESEYEEPLNNPIPEQQIQNGSYKICFRLSPEPFPGIYTISVSYGSPKLYHNI